MIRLRDKNGNVVKLPEEVSFVEVCDLDNNIACAVYLDTQKFAHIVTSSSKEAPRYAGIFNVTFSKIIDLPKELIE